MFRQSYLQDGVPELVLEVIVAAINLQRTVDDDVHPGQPRRSDGVPLDRRFAPTVAKHLIDSTFSRALWESATSPHERENHPHGMQGAERRSRTESTGFQN